MSLRHLPAPKALQRPDSLGWDAPSEALVAWAERPRAAEADEPNTISVYDVIGYDPWSGDGVTARRVAGALRAIGQKPVTVAINSPGGDMFEGLAIYNLLREHPAEVNVRVMGLAASAASIIAMAGDRIEMGLGSFLMIHNAWGVVIGDSEEMIAAGETFRQFNAAMAEIYAARSGLDEAEIRDMMTAESWIRASEAVDRGFADGTFDGPEEAPETAAARAEVSARRKLDAALARAGMPRSERRQLMREAAAGTPGAAGTAMPSAGFDEGAARRLLETLKAKG